MEETLLSHMHRICGLIEKLPASEAQTTLSIEAAALRQRLQAADEIAENREIPALLTYQQYAGETAIYPSRAFAMEVYRPNREFPISRADHVKAWTALAYVSGKLASEAGEVTGKVCKIARDNDFVVIPEHKLAIKKELGDVVWYVAENLTLFGFTLEDCLRENRAHLKDRQMRGVLRGSGDNR